MLFGFYFSSEMDAGTVCNLCHEVIEESEKKASLGQRQLEKFIRKSKIRDDDFWLSWEKGQCIQVHETCRKRYAAKPETPPQEKRRRTSSPVPSPSSTPRSESSKTGTPGPSLFSTAQPELSTFQSSTSNQTDSNEFDFKNLCFICGKPFDLRHKEIRRVQDHLLKDRLLAIANSRDDDLGEEVLSRLKGNCSLVQAKAAYHKICYNRFVQQIYDRQPLENAQNEQAFCNLINHIQNAATYKFNLKELRDVIGDNTMSDTILFRKLKQKYGDEIFISRNPGRQTEIFFKQFDIAKICGDWFCSDGNISDHRRAIILNVAADILRADIEIATFNTTSYSPPAEFLQTVATDIPANLQTFLGQLLYKNDPEKEAEKRGTRDSIAHAIVSALRPRAFISNLQLAIGTYIHRKTGSKLVIDLLSKLGLCASYHNLKLFELSTIMDPPKMNVEEDSFVQFVFDNTDHNVSTLDGRETFHCLGGIAVYTPEENISYEGGSKKLGKMPTTAVVASQKRIPIVPYEAPNRNGMDDFTFTSVTSLRLGNAPLLPCTYATYLWGKYFKSVQLPSWKGFMEVLSADETFSKRQSCIVCLPFINAPPSNLTTLHTALQYAKTETTNIRQKTTFLTFDQPLYWKSKSIVANLAYSTMKNVVVLLGIFHLLMSFMGAIGYSMQESGLEDLWSVIYAPESVKKMISGHAFSRALRAHILTFTALGRKICSSSEAPQKWKDFMNEFLLDWQSKTRGECTAETEIREMTKAFEKQMRILENNGPTSKLWIQYFKSVVILLQLIEAERLGDWELHLQSVRNSLPLFHAAGHHAYAKTAQMYLQDMVDLELHMDPQEYDAFTKGGFFTIRRTDKAWAGISRDMLIEQTLNRFFGTDLKHGRGVTPSVVTRYLLAMPAAFTIMEQLEDYCEIRTANSEQHVDLKPSRIARDEQDIEKLMFWLDSHNPFDCRNSLVSLSSGVIGGPFINCHMAYEKGEQSMATMIGKTPQKVSISRSFKVKNFTSAVEGIHLSSENTAVKIDTQLLFQKISVLLRGNAEMTKKGLNYELTPVPLSLFDEKGWMRTSAKSELYALFTPTNLYQSLLADCQFVVDGGWLLRQITWPHGKTFSEILQLYRSYILRYFRDDAVVIFDGYKNDVIGVKSYERLRRREKFVAADIDIGLDKMVTSTKDKFLSNVVNKFKFVKLLSEYLMSENISTKVAEEDADALIINTAVEMQSRRQSADKPIVVVGNDVDLFVLLIGLTPIEETIYFYKIISTGKKQKSLYSTKDHKGLRAFILFAHALVGCDSTSALFGKGEKSVIKLLEKDESICQSISIFYDQNRTVDELYPVAEDIVKRLYGKGEETLLPINELRHKMFISSVADAKKDVLATLPPTQAALIQHVKRVYYQIQQWLSHKLDPLEWGWERLQMLNVILVPKKTSQKAAPDDLLAMVS